MISILEYLKFETQINYKNVIQPIAVFPAVTFCNLNPFDLKGNNSDSSSLFIDEIFSNNSLNISLANSADYDLATTKEAITV